MTQPIKYKQTRETAQPTAQSSDPIARGVLRTPSQKELANWNEFDNPVTIKNKKTAGNDDTLNDYTAIPFDSNDLEIPTFLRRKAD
jgi:cell division protein FtsZ